MQAIILLVGVIFYFFICHMVGAKASDKGGSYFLWFIVSLIFSPVVGFVLMSLFT